MLQNATVSGNQHPDFLTSLMTMSLGLRLPRKMHLCRSSSNVPRLPSFLEMLQNPHVLLTFEKVHNPLRLSRETTSERPKVLCTPQLFALLASKCASRHNSVHFFNIATSKSGPNMVCVVHFDLAMCFARQRRALFRHLNFQKWSGPGVLCTFWLRNVLCTTTAVTFSTSQLPKVVRLTSKCASRHNGVQFFIAHLVSWLRTRRFSEPTFRPSEPQIIAKTKCFATLLPFRTPGSSFFWIFFLLRLSLFWSSFFFSSLLSSSLLFSLLLFSSLLFSSRLVSSRLVSSLLFSSLTLTTSAFHLSILSEVWLLNFLRLFYMFIVFLYSTGMVFQFISAAKTRKMKLVLVRKCSMSAVSMLSRMQRDVDGEPSPQHRWNYLGVSLLLLEARLEVSPIFGPTSKVLQNKLL